jgi:hypothetical protein
MKEYTLFILLLLIVGLTALLVDRVHESFESGSTAGELTLTDIQPVGSSSSSQAVITEPQPAEPVGSSSSSQRATLTPESEPASVGSSSSSMMGDIPVQPFGSSSSSMRATVAPAGATTTPPAGQQQQQQRYGSLPFGNVIIINTPTNPNSNNTAYRDDILPQEQPEETSPTVATAQPPVAPEATPLSTSKIVAVTAFGAAGVGALYMFMKG